MLSSFPLSNLERNEFIVILIAIGVLTMIYFFETKLTKGKISLMADPIESLNPILKVI